MELRVLKYFLTVAQEESFSRAAEKLHLTQPTLSRQLKDLEDEFGKQLLIREPRRILLTEDGQLLRRRRSSGVRAGADAVKDECGRLTLLLRLYLHLLYALLAARAGYVKTGHAFRSASGSASGPRAGTGSSACCWACPTTSPPASCSRRWAPPAP